MRAVQKIDDPAEHGLVLLRQGIANRVGQIDGRCARSDGALHRLAQEIDITAAGVFGGEFNFRATLAPDYLQNPC